MISESLPAYCGCMGRQFSSPATINLRGFARLAAEKLAKVRPCQASPKSASSPKILVRCAAKSSDSAVAGAVTAGEMDRSDERMRLSEVVSDCVKRWFQDTLKEAKSGDITMQVLVGQMYYNGYGISRNAQKGKAWISRASRHRPSASKVADKRPGYNVSDSDSEELNGDER